MKYSDIPKEEIEKIVIKSTREANREQKRVVDEYEKQRDNLDKV